MELKARICPNCGAGVSNDVNRCDKCGTPFGINGSTQPTPPNHYYVQQVAGRGGLNINAAGPVVAGGDIIAGDKINGVAVIDHYNPTSYYFNKIRETREEVDKLTDTVLAASVTSTIDSIVLLSCNNKRTAALLLTENLMKKCRDANLVPLFRKVEQILDYLKA